MGDQNRASKPIPIHLIAFGDYLANIGEVLREYRRGEKVGDTYSYAPDSVALQKALSVGRQGYAIVMCVEGKDIGDHLIQNREAIKTSNALVFARSGDQQHLDSRVAREFAVRFCDLGEQSINGFPNVLEKAIRRTQNAGNANRSFFKQ